jgi:hypothetical protein
LLGSPSLLGQLGEFSEVLGCGSEVEFVSRIDKSYRCQPANR